MSDDDPNNSGSEDSFYGEQNKDKNNDAKDDEVITKNNLHKLKKKPISKRKEKGAKSGKRSFNTKQKQKQVRLYQFAERKASTIIEQMDKKYNRDLQLYQKKQIACKKLTYLDQLSKDLKNVYISDKFLQQNGLGVFQKWLTKVNIGQHGESVEPSIALRKGIFQILASLNVRSDHIVRAQELQRIIQRNKRSQTKQLRDLSEQIISKWSQMTYEDAE